MSDQKTSFLIIGLIIGIVVGFGGNYILTQPKITTLNQELVDLENENAEVFLQLENLTSTINALSEELNQKTIELEQVTDELSSTKTTLNDLYTKMENITSYSDELTKIKKIFEALNTEYPESEASQVLWRQNVIKKCEELNSTLGVLRDRYEADSEAARLLLMEEPDINLQEKWINWVLEWFEALEPVNESGQEFEEALFGELIDTLNDLDKAMH